MRFSGMSQIVVAVGIALGLLTLFQNCSRIQLGGPSKSLVQGAAISSIISTEAHFSKPTSDQGLCTVVCGLKQKSESANSRSSECDDSVLKEKSVVQTLSTIDDQPKTVCMSQAACQLIGAGLASGKIVLMKTASSYVSTLKASHFEPIKSDEDCQDTLSDYDVRKQFEPET